MKVKTVCFKENNVHIYPIGDLHIGDKAFDKESERKVKGYIEWVKQTPNARIFLLGDILNCATRDSKSNPFEQNMDLKEQIDHAVKLFMPVKDKIIGAIDGNHELRISNYTGYSPTISLCERLGIDYLGDSAVVIFRLCKKYPRGSRASFSGFFHHSTGGGGSVGSKIDVADRLRKIICDADFYAIGHNHMLGCIHSMIYKINETTEKVEEFRQMLVDCGGYIGYKGSYAERKMLQPLKIGSPRIHLFIKRSGGGKSKGEEKIKKDIHVSL